MVGLLSRHVLAWEVVALAAALSPLALSESSEWHVRSCRATRYRVAPNAAGRPRRWGPPSVVSQSLQGFRVGGAAGRGKSLLRSGLSGAGAGLRGRPELAGPSITEGEVGGIKTIYA